MAAATRKSFLLLSILFLVTLALGEGTRTWEQSKFDDLTKGTPQGVAIRSAGGWNWPRRSKLSTPRHPRTFGRLPPIRWAICTLPAGGPARVYEVTPAGQSSTIFETHELQVQALAVGKNGEIYAATNPDGKVYKNAGT